MSIQTDVNELNNLNIEIKRLSKTLHTLRVRKGEVEKRITEFLVAKDQPGVKYQGVAILSQDKVKHVYKPKKAKNEDCIEVLKKYGVNNPDVALNEVLTAMKGEETTTKKLKIQKLTK